MPSLTYTIRKAAALPGEPSKQENRAFWNLLVFGPIVIFAIVLVKARTAVSLWSNPFLFFYTIFVTSFQLARIGAAMVYSKASATLLDSEDDDYEPKVSIVVPCKNEEGVIRNTVVKCLQARYPKEKLEVIVINDGSTDGTSRVLQSLRNELDFEDRRRLIIIEWAKNRGKRQAMAEGFARASGEIVVQLDSDSYISPEDFRKLVLPFKNEEIGGISAHTDPENADENLLTKMQSAYYFISFRILKAAEATFFTVLCLSGCSSAYRKKAVLPVLDEWLGEKFLGLPATWGDDRALTSRLLKTGWKTLYTDRVKAYTVVPATLRQLLRQQLRWKKSWIVNSILTSRFLYRTHPFFAVSYFLPLVIITLATPLVTLAALIWAPLAFGLPPLYYLVGIFLVTSLIILYYRLLAPKNSYWPYLYLWSLLNTFLLSFLIIWAAFRLRDRRWGTR